MMNFCIPYITIEPIVGKLSAQFWYSSVRRNATSENLNVLKEKLATVDVNVVAEIGKINIPVRDVLSLQKGDVIRLYNASVDEPYSLNIGSKPKFLCRPGLVGNKLAVQITRRIAEIADEDFDELNDGEVL
jgi:flagellar motor switch protein FliM